MTRDARSRFGAAVGALVLAVLPARSLAEPPWRVDDPGVTARGVLTVYDGAELSWEPGGRAASWPGWALTYGASDRLDLALGAAALTTTERGRLRRIEWTDLALGGKWLLLGTPDDPRLAVALQATFPLGTGGSSAPTRGGWLTGRLPLGAFRLTWNVGGLVASGDGLTSAFAGWVLDLPLGERTAVGLEIAGTTAPERGGRADATWAIGFRNDLGGGANLHARVGTSLVRPSEGSVLVGLSVDLEPRAGGGSP